MKILQTIRTHIPALDGWYLLTPVVDGGQLGKRKVVGMARVPIIGWLLITLIRENDLGGDTEDESNSIPITASSVLSMDDEAAVIEAPRALYMSFDGSVLAGKEDAFTYLKEEVARQDALVLRRINA